MTVPPQVAHHRGAVARTSSGEEAPKGATRRMVATRVGDLHHPPSCCPEPQAEVDILRPEGCRRVETAHLRERVAAEYLAGADGELDLPKRAGPLLGRARVDVRAIEGAQQLASQAGSTAGGRLRTLPGEHWGTQP